MEISNLWIQSQNLAYGVYGSSAAIEMSATLSDSTADAWDTSIAYSSTDTATDWMGSAVVDVADQLMTILAATGNVTTTATAQTVIAAYQASLDMVI